jgi:hypothetical protein
VIEISLPPGARKVEAPGFERDGDRLIWDSEVKEDQILEVSWQR